VLQAFQIMRAALAPKGYKIENPGARIERHATYAEFTVTKTAKAETGDVRRVLGKFPTYPAEARSAGYEVTRCATDERFVKVAWKDYDHTSYVEDRTTFVFTRLGNYAAMLEDAGYVVSRLKDEEAILVGVKGSRGFPTTSVAKPKEEALQVLRDVLEFEFLEVYTRVTPGRNSIFVMCVTPKGSRRLEVFYDEQTGEYRAIPWSGGYFGSLRSRDLGKVQDFVRTELEG
jgi:hypothetical protein